MMAFLKNERCICGGRFRVHKSVYDNKTIVGTIVCTNCGNEKQHQPVDFYKFISEQCVPEK